MSVTALVLSPTLSISLICNLFLVHLRCRHLIFSPTEKLCFEINKVLCSGVFVSGLSILKIDLFVYSCVSTLSNAELFRIKTYIHYFMRFSLEYENFIHRAIYISWIVSFNFENKFFLFFF